MQITFGKHDGKSVELLILQEPNYINWVLQQSASGMMLQVKTYAATLIKRFDDKPLLERCRAKDCSECATCATFYLDNLSPVWWCANCDQYQLSANPGTLHSVATYAQALSHVEFYCNGRKLDAVKIIKHLAKAKGLPTRVTEAHAQAFFAKRAGA